MSVYSNFRSVAPADLSDNFFTRIGNDWMLITAENGRGEVNTMTASWGCAGILWNKPVAICFIRPQRYTYGIAEDADTLTLSFFAPGEYREALRYCGTKSGRDGDKFAAAGLTVARAEGGAPFVEEANLVLVCRKLYADDLKEGCFVDPEMLKHYAAKDYHRFYICEIREVLVREAGHPSDDKKPNHIIRIQDHTVPDLWGRDTRNSIVSKIEDILQNIRARGVYYVGRRDCVTGYDVDEFYDWDLYFETLFLSYFGSHKFCRNNVELFLNQQQPNGFVSRTYRNPRPTHHFKPFLAQTALLGIRQSHDPRWLSDVYYDRLKKYLDYWFSSCDADGNGLCYWDGSDHSGMDNQARRLGYMGVMEYEGVDLNCYLVRELDAMAEIAKVLGLSEDASDFTARAEILRRRINELLWDENDGFYYDRSEKTGELNRIKSIAGFMPLWCGAASPEQAERLVREHLANPDEFWTRYPIATWSKSEPDYNPTRTANICNWMGSTWIPTNYMVFRGLLDYGYTEIARELADKTFEMVVSEECLREFYNSENGNGLGRCPFWGWSSLGYIMKAELECGVTNSDLKTETFATLEGFNF